MKKFWKYLAISAIAVGVLPLAACSDDETVDPYTLNYCYVYQPYSTYAQLEYKANGQFLVDIDNPVTLMPVRLTKPAPRDLTITVAIDESLVAEYNEANGTDYSFLTGCTIENPTLHIKSGEYVSTKSVTQTVADPADESGEGTISQQVVVNDSIVVNFGDKSGFQAGAENLILPVVITNADGMTISKSSRIFLTFSSTYKSNKISSNFITMIKNNPDETGWESANTNLTLTDFFKCQWAADDDISISVAIDNSLIDAFNTENETNYLPLPGTTVKTSTVNIAKGASSADLQMTMGDYSGIANEKEYLVPLKLTLNQGVGAELKSETVYIAMVNIPNELTAVDSSMPSGFTQIPYQSSWVGTNLSVSEGEEDMTSILINANTYHGFETGDISTIDLGETTTVEMFSIRFYAWYYANNELTNVQTSTDGTKWTDWGAAELGDEAYWYITFSKPAKFRYIRWTWGDYAYSSYYGTFARQISFYNK